MIKAIGLGIVALLFLVILFVSIFPIVEVIGESMMPTYHNGEFLIGYRFFPKAKLKVGDVIVYRLPHDTDTCVIKRIDRITASIYDDNNLLFYCLGDNSDNSYDSRNYGYISQEYIVCRLLEQRRK